MLEEEKKDIYFRIQKLKLDIKPYKEDVEQVVLFGMERTDFEQKKEYCKNIILELRSLEKQLKQLENNENSNS